MLEPMINALKGEFAQKAAAQLGLSGTETETVMNCVSNSFVDTLKKEVFAGKLNEAINLFSGQSSPDTSNPLVAALHNGLLSTLKDNAGIAAERAQEISSFTVPYALNKVIETFKASGHSADIDGFAAFAGIDKSILKMVSGPAAGLLGKFFG